jgi:hypothetical protein
LVAFPKTLRKESEMKYVVSWETRPNATEESSARSLEVFGKWAPAEGVTFVEFLGRVDGRGGFSVVETDDPALIARDTALFSAFFDFTVHPVLEIADAAALGIEAVQTLASVT